MNTPTYQPREVLQFTAPATVVSQTDNVVTLALRLDDGPAELVTVRLDTHMVTLRRTTPADGTPQPGQIWADNRGEHYWATTDGDLIDTKGRRSLWTFIHEGHGPITRVHPKPAKDGDQ
ncbi:hypothetical protein [Sphaerimonospora thailandensis]|uniref:Uncharacterized protein n=1 Tax=Sphaerimonospora thailandensis TaxID=795644 RepID=A0A8J3R819_9ACTN|nr:hypothetical protein [Sphaerimonospora thailandensis]GIH69486.1 hypothetical protein Mth01_17390 [Sphaerimonospora thailandensis]